MRQTVAFVILLLPMMAEGSQPHGTYQRATIQEHDGVPLRGCCDDGLRLTLLGLLLPMKTRC
jgi:hypothetical protein